MVDSNTKRVFDGAAPNVRRHLNFIPALPENIGYESGVLSELTGGFDTGCFQMF